jgi:Protein of unknown function (DUF2478)
VAQLAFDAAVAARKPVLTASSENHIDVWRAFAPGAVTLAADISALQKWWSGVES